jgi:hypothetical protein
MTPRLGRSESFIFVSLSLEPEYEECSFIWVVNFMSHPT